MSFPRLSLKLVASLCLLAAVVMLSACQPALIFVVANETNAQIEVRYVVKKSSHTDVMSRLEEIPAVKPVAELDERTEWRDLNETRFKFTPETRTVVLTLNPREALRIERTNFTCNETESWRTDSYTIEELTLIGPSGTIRLTGKQARTSFASGPRGACVLTYR